MREVNKIKDEAEEYYIQFWFCENRQLLKKDMREIYDEGLKIYQDIYLEAKENGINDLFLIGEKFRKRLCGIKK